MLRLQVVRLRIQLQTAYAEEPTPQEVQGRTRPEKFSKLRDTIRPCQGQWKSNWVSGWNRARFRSRRLSSITRKGPRKTDWFSRRNSVDAIRGRSTRTP